MWRNALFATAFTLLVIAQAAMSYLGYLIPYKRVVWHMHAIHLGVFFLLVSINLYAFYFLLTRKLLLKDSGRKFSHIEKQVREGSVFQELSERLSEE